MTSSEPDSASFEALSRELLKKGITVRFQARGQSMSPTIRNDETVHVTPVIITKLREGDIVLTKGDKRFLIHRLVVANHDENVFITRGDCSQQDDAPVTGEQILGLAIAKELRLGKIVLRMKLTGISGKLLLGYEHGRALAGRILRKAGLRRSSSGPHPTPPASSTLLAIIGILLFLLTASHSQAQVAVDTDPSTSNSADLTGPGTETLTFNHTTSATANRALLVGVSLNIANSAATTVTGITYNGTALTLVGAQNDGTNTRRMEMWYLLNPASGTNLPIIVSVNVPTAVTVGVVAGATVFTDVDQTVPLGAFVSAEGEEAGCVATTAAGDFQCNSQANAASVVNGMVFDTLAVGMGQITVNGPQVQQWNVTSGGANPNAIQDVIGTASIRAGAPSVPVSEGFNEVLNLTAVAPSTTTLTLTAAGAAAGGDTVYTGTITGGAGNAYVGDTVVVAGFTNAKDNGTFTCVASTATTITVNNANGVAQTHAGTATVTIGTVYTGTITGGAGNGFAGDSFVIAGFTNADNNGTFTATASTATTLTVNNTAGVAQTHAGTATTNATFNWAQGAISVNPSVADIGVTISVGSAVFLGQSTTYNITVFNNGTSAANAVTLSDQLASGMTLGTVTPSAGVTCVTTTNPITCTIGTLASGAQATVAVTETATTSGAFANTATVADSGTPPDPNTGNNSFTAVATVQAAACANVSQAGPASSPLTGVLNSYYPGKASVAAGATSITLGAATGGPGGTPTAIAAGNLLLVIQMQDASISTSDTVTYGNNSTGQGFTALNSAGNYEFVTAASAVPVGGGTLTLTGSGAGGGLVFGYDALAASGTKGQSTFQVILVPQYTTATLATTGLTAEAWNGSTGGVLALDTSGALTLNGATVVMDGMGFRGGAGLQLSGVPNPPPPTAPSSNDFQQPAPATYTGTTTGSTGNGQAGWDGSKGEGIAGTPAWVEELITGNTTPTPVATATGYPSGAYGQFNVTSVANAGGGDTVYTGTFTGGAGNTLAGYTFVVSGFSNAANNGRFVSTASTATTLTLNNAAGVAQTGTATANLDGSMARGAPGNAGGGGTDADPDTTTQGGNDQNTGGGGGANGGSGGFGGDSWDTNLSTGGEGGAAFPATVNRVAMGGGGGAGTRNNSNGDTQASSGAAGGGIIIIRTYALSGNATLTANGVSAYNGTLNDGGGGAGAGGSIVVLSANGGESGLTLEANGGVGGDAWGTEPFTLGNRHGPGGGGGGGVLIVSGTPASASVNGGASGTTETPGVDYGATSGAAGFSVTNASITQTSGTQSGAECTPDMTVAKSHVGNFIRGLTANYTLTASNVSAYGPTDATVTVNDTLPTGINPTGAGGTGWTCSVVSQTVSCVDSTVLAAGGSYPSITVSANVAQTAPSTVTNTAVVGGGGEVNLANDTATDVANVVSSADLSMANTASPNPVTAGSNITYSQVLTNNGPSSADNATLTETVPTNTTFVSMSAPTGWSCTTPAVGGTGNISCTNVTLVGNTAATFSLIVKVAAGTASGTVITDTATASSSTSDPNSANNTATASTLVGTTTQGEMTVTNSASPYPVLAGNDITYLQAATNTGGGTANAPSLTENTPANTVFESITAPPGTTCTTPPVGSAGAITCTGAAAPAGSTGTVVLIVQVNAGTASGTVITDTVAVNSSNQAFGANSATATDVVATSTQADLALATSATPLTLIAGNDITYTQTVTNNGPAAAANVNFTEAIPANTTFVSVSAPVGWSCTTTTSLVCTDTSLAAGSSANIIVAFNVAPSVAAGTITANSSVSSSTSDPYMANNSTSVSTPLIDDCDLGVTNSGTPSPITAGSDITYTQTVTNGGPSNCSAGTFTEATPANTTFVSVSATTTGGGTWTCPNSAPISCTNPSVVPGSVGTITAVYQVNAGTAAGTIISDTVTGNTSTNDSNLSNNTATVTIGVAVAGEADLSVTDTGTPSPVTAGQNITFAQTVANAGPASASTVKLTETLPANTTFVSLTGPAGWTCTATAPYSCSIATLAANATANFTFVVQVGSGVASGTAITDAASVASSVTTDPNLGNNSASSTVYVADSANLSVTDSATPVPVEAGNTITYTQVVTNSGPSVAANATFTETTPANTTFSSLTPIPAGWSCTLPTAGNAGTISCSDPSFAVGTASFPVILTVTAGTAAGTAINDTVSVTTSTTDPNTTNNTATAADVVALASQADLVATNSAAPTSVAAGSDVTYTESVTNKGPAIANAGATFTQTTPPNTTFVSVTPPAGWTCTSPAAGGTGTIKCTATGTMAVNSTANFTVVLQVVSGTPSGTNIAETATATVGNIVPNLTTNSATADVIVANANSADMAIVKTASPSPTVPDGDILTYTLAVTNNGPATATDVTVTDSLPADVTYLSAVSTQGTCSEADGTVTCLLGTMNDASTATVTILTLAGSPGTASNTATVSADQTDPNLTNNTSTQVETITASTEIQLHALVARMVKDKTGTNRAALFWKTGAESHNLGFNVYREENGQRVKATPSLIAGSALLTSGALPKHSGKTYAWIDSSSSSGDGVYWLEDVDVNGTRTMHGPVTLEVGTTSTPETAPATSLTLNQISQSQPAASSNEGSHPLESVLRDFKPTPAQRALQFELAAHPAVKIFVLHEGWHRVTQTELIQAGLDPNVDPALLHLYAEAMEQPIQITGASSGPGGFGPQATIQFYGTGVDNPYTGIRVYWLVEGRTPGLRIPQLPPSTGSNLPPEGFSATVAITPHTTYFSSLITQNGNNFFGALVSSTPVEQTLTITNLDQNSTAAPQLEVILQGVVLAFPHDVTVALNGTSLGDLTFTGQSKGRFDVSIPPGILQEGGNTVTLTAQDGEYDVSLVQTIGIRYPHSYVADSDALKFFGRAGDQVKITGFTRVPVVVLDITNPDRPVQLTPQITSNVASNTTQYELEVQVPWSSSSTSPALSDLHTLIALAADRIDGVADVHHNHPSQWYAPQPGSEIVMVSPGQFAESLKPLLRLHEAQGNSTALVLIDDLYDEFTFGEHNPHAIREFLRTATKTWHTPPHYLLLNGRASLDPRNYLGFGFLDFVPTKIVSATGMMTASDDWFSDFNNSGMPTIATGRLPVSTPDEASQVAGRIAAYEGRSTGAAWTSQALMVADVNDTENFTQDSRIVQAELPSTIRPVDVFASTMSTSQAQQAIVAGIDSGKLLVNYAGHGSEEEWSGDDLFDDTAATALTNGSSLPVFLIMDCLNGFFQDVYEEPLAVALMLAPNGGAVAVLASSGLNQPSPQTKFDKLIVQNAFNAPYPALGDAILNAKSGINDISVRETFNLLGDPAMRIKSPAQ
jgi:uncharacterized repeat protein (TIGR01451 family)